MRDIINVWPLDQNPRVINCKLQYNIDVPTNLLKQLQTVYWTLQSGSSSGCTCVDLNIFFCTWSYQTKKSVAKITVFQFLLRCFCTVNLDKIIDKLWFQVLGFMKVASKIIDFWRFYKFRIFWRCTVFTPAISDRPKLKSKLYIIGKNHKYQ